MYLDFSTGFGVFYHKVPYTSTRPDTIPSIPNPTYKTIVLHPLEDFKNVFVKNYCSHMQSQPVREVVAR